MTCRSLLWVGETDPQSSIQWAEWSTQAAEGGMEDRLLPGLHVEEEDTQGRRVCKWAAFIEVRDFRRMRRPLACLLKCTAVLCGMLPKNECLPLCTCIYLITGAGHVGGGRFDPYGKLVISSLI